MNAGHLLPSECDANLAQEAAELNTTQHANTAKLARAAACIDMVVPGGGPQPLLRWYGHVGCMHGLGGNDKLSAVLDHLHIRLETDASKLASVSLFILPGTANPPRLVKWVAQIRGSALVVPEVLTGEREGP